MSRLVRPSVRPSQRPTTLPAGMNNEVALMMIYQRPTIVCMCHLAPAPGRPPTLRPAVSLFFVALLALVTHRERVFCFWPNHHGARRCLAFGLLRFPLVLSAPRSSLVEALSVTF